MRNLMRRCSATNCAAIVRNEVLMKNELSEKFTEIIAKYVDAKEQVAEGVLNIDHERWLKRYRGSHNPNSDKLMFNTFNPQVDCIVGQLMCVIDDLEGFTTGSEIVKRVDDYEKKITKFTNATIDWLQTEHGKDFDFTKIKTFTELTLINFAK